MRGVNYFRRSADLIVAAQPISCGFSLVSVLSFAAQVKLLRAIEILG
jgi:hypothetical protein